MLSVSTASTWLPLSFSPGANVLILTDATRTDTVLAFPAAETFTQLIFHVSCAPGHIRHSLQGEEQTDGQPGGTEGDQTGT